MDPLRTAAESAIADRAATLWSEFREFAFKGNVVDLAVGVVIGAAFGRIVESLVKSVLMPAVGLLLPGDEGFRGWKLVVRGQEILYGLFIAEVVNFLVVAGVLFLFVHKFLSWTGRLRDQVPPTPPAPPSRQEELLAEIRDLLKARP